MMVDPLSGWGQYRRRLSALAWALLIAASLLAGVTVVVTAIPSATAASGQPGGRATIHSAAHATSQSEIYPNCRFGVGGAIDGFDVASLNIGWYLDWSAQMSPTVPAGVEYVRVILLEATLSGVVFTPDTSTLQSLATAHPGTIWLVSNEPDSPFQDDILPEDYAQAYHRVHTLLKQFDPSARVGVGSLVQPTPLRFQYLDRFTAAYQQNFGERPPADVWSIHSYILREIDASDPEAFPNGPYEVWGAFIPPGITVTRGVLYSYSDMFRADIFLQRLRDFREWMADNGYRNVPLYITEYGELFPYPPYIAGDPYLDETGKAITEMRVATFMTETFNTLLTAADLSIGYPADANRLVQRWLWYSVSDVSFGGALFDPASRVRRPLGDVWYTYTHSISPGVDLLAVSVIANPPVLSDTGQLQTTTLEATISNIGNISLTSPFTVSFYAGWPPTGTLIDRQVVAPPLDGCAATAEVSRTWSSLGPGAHPMYVEVDAGPMVSETSGLNNQAAGVFLVATHRAYLPAVLKR
jgi:hypothetical protein